MEGISGSGLDRGASVDRLVVVEQIFKPQRQRDFSQHESRSSIGNPVCSVLALLGRCRDHCPDNSRKPQGILQSRFATMTAFQSGTSLVERR
ncbi:hypothetical protein BN1263170239 [Stenotrophomonas maltophilia]|nr:hypothetical protein BN1263170239 [Stenotrophomonas maltophilia]